MHLECTVDEVKSLMSGNQPPVLVDVRTPEEWDIVHLEGARLLTQELLDEMTADWSPETPIICYCHHGVRSVNATMFLREKGFHNVRSMRGGIDLWSQEIDGSLPRY